ncbi:Alpha/Beta hydrolase protein, partial [Hyaloraphidium curvatum]
YCVLIVDNRGSWDRGLVFEAPLQGRFATVEVMDQIEALLYVMRKYHGARRLVDPDRIAVTGWSYGGYLSLMMLAQHPNIVRVAVAGAPVTQWSLYDTAYTERFLSRPSDNPGGYSRSSVLDVAHCLPDEENRLLIVHGAMDENVHITHSLMLVSALVKLNKPHQIQIYPNERHGLRQPGNAEHYDTLFFHFLARAFRDVERA